MNLGILVTIISGFGKKGFYHSQEIGLGKALAEMGHRVCIYKCIPRDGSYEEDALRDNLTIKYIPTKRIGVHGNINTSYIDPELDGLLSFADTQLFLPHVFRFCKKHNIKLIPYIGIAHSFQQTAKSRMMDKLFSMGTLRYYKEVPVLAKTMAAREELKELGVKHCEVAPVGLDVSELRTDFRKSDRSELRRKFGFDDSDVIISFVARLKPEKRPLDLIAIMNHIKNGKRFKLLMVGEGPERKAIDAKIVEYGLSDKIRILDRVPYEDMWEVYRISDYFINLRAEEIFGMAVMEAVYYQTSVAAINAPGPATILFGMKGHQICKDDEEVEKWLVSEYPLQEDLVFSSERIINEFTWDTCATKFINAIQLRNA